MMFFYLLLLLGEMMAQAVPSNTPAPASKDNGASPTTIAIVTVASILFICIMVVAIYFAINRQRKAENQDAAKEQYYRLMRLRQNGHLKGQASQARSQEGAGLPQQSHSSDPRLYRHPSLKILNPLSP